MIKREEEMNVFEVMSFQFLIVWFAVVFTFGFLKLLTCFEWFEWFIDGFERGVEL